MRSTLLASLALGMTLAFAGCEDTTKPTTTTPPATTTGGDAPKPDAGKMEPAGTPAPAPAPAPEKPEPK